VLYAVDETPLDGTPVPMLTLRMDNVSDGWQQRFLLASDVHFDSPKCDRKLFFTHLKQAQEQGAGLILIGDLYDAMQGRDDPRRNKAALRPEYQGGNYLDLIVEDVVEQLLPYRENIVAIGDGNHETSVRRKLETDLIGRTCRELRVPRLGYSGFVRFMTQRNGGGRHSFFMYYHHGHGSGGASSQGASKIETRAATYPDADLIVTGHIHNRWTHSFPRVRASAGGRIYEDEQTHVQLPTYKSGFDLTGGWEIERGMKPKPRGGAWLEFYWSGPGETRRGHVTHRIQWAV
jgi:predicted phosphodiesterase